MTARTLLIAATLAASCAGAARADVLISVDKGSQRMSVSVDGEQVHDWPVSTGMRGYRTPEGKFKPFRMEADHRSKEWDDAPMPNSIFFTDRGHAIHGSGHVGRLGTPASHGCVRLRPANAATLFSLVKAEGMARTRVVISGEEPSAPVMAARPRRPRVRVVDQFEEVVVVPAPARRSAERYVPYGSGGYVPYDAYSGYGRGYYGY